jgi:subtilisin family serine protease
MNIELLPDSIKVKKRTKRGVVDKLDEPIIYSPSAYGIDNLCTGKKVKIAILDSGCPRHKDIKVISDKISFCEENLGSYDSHGHATMISGIINAKNKKAITGLAPHAEIQYGRVINSKGDCSFNALVAGVLWSIVKGVDIIVISMGTQYDYVVLKDAIKKARDYGICIFAACGDNNIDENWQADFPARYENVISTGFMTRNKTQNNILSKKIDFNLPNKGLYTTYLDDKYIKVSGSSVSAAFYAGLAAVLVEQYKRERKADIPTEVYAKLCSIFK